MPNRIVRANGLKDGMKVLFADPGYEGHLDRFINDHSDLLSAGALGHCYWRKISQITYSRDGETVSFATHDNNGVPLNRQMPIEYRLIIKIDTKREKVLDLVEQALSMQDRAARNDNQNFAPEASSVVDEIYKILGL